VDQTFYTGKTCVVARLMRVFVQSLICTIYRESTLEPANKLVEKSYQLPPRMILLMRVAEVFVGNVGIYLGRSDIGVTKEDLHTTQVGAV
jgi:hypothetical protein